MLNSYVNSSSESEIMRPFCPICSALMDEIDIGGDVVYFCGCGISTEPVFINTFRVEGDRFLEIIDELIDVKIQLAEFNLRETDLKNSLLNEMKDRCRITRDEVKIEYRSYCNRESMKWSDASKYIQIRYGNNVLEDIIANCATVRDYVGIAVTLSKKIKADCKERAMLKKPKVKKAKILPLIDFFPYPHQ